MQWVCLSFHHFVVLRFLIDLETVILQVETSYTLNVINVSNTVCARKSIRKIILEHTQFITH